MIPDFFKKSIKLSEIRGLYPPPEIQKLEVPDYKIAWIVNYYDMPLSGMLLYNKAYFWFEVTQEIRDRDIGQWVNRYAVVALTIEQMEQEIIVHKDFLRFVGDHFDEEPFADAPEFIEGQHHVFYEKHGAYCNSRPFEGNDVVAWFEFSGRFSTLSLREKEKSRVGLRRWRV